MTSTIEKFIIQSVDRQTIEIPQHAEILSVGLERGTVCVWAITDREKPLERRTFEIVSTWDPMPELAGGAWREFIGSTHQGLLVWHVFELLEDQS